MSTHQIKPSICSIAWRDEPIDVVLPIAAQAGYLGVEVWPRADADDVQALHLKHLVVVQVSVRHLVLLKEGVEVALADVCCCHDLAVR
mgnify:CR=1 FL=1